MANTLGILERTLAQVAQSDDVCNVVNPVGTNPQQQRLYTEQGLTIRITDHTDNDAGETGTDTNLMALFHSKSFGAPWCKLRGDESETIHANAAGSNVTATVSDLFPNFDYTDSAWAKLT